MTKHLAVALGIVCSTAASPALAQVVTLDEGSFTITVNGERVGREEFRIRSTPGAQGPSIIASATVAYTDRRVNPMMSADSSGAPLQYVVEVKGGAGLQEKLSGTLSRGRISVRIQNPRGESAREYVVAEGALILDDEVFHQYYFLTAANRKSGSVPVVIPRRNAQVMMQVSSGGRDRVTVGSQTLDAERLVIREPGGEREVWVDGQGRVLKVAIPSKGIVAIRDDPPR